MTVLQKLYTFKYIVMILGKRSTKSEPFLLQNPLPLQYFVTDRRQQKVQIAIMICMVLCCLGFQGPDSPPSVMPFLPGWQVLGREKSPEGYCNSRKWPQWTICGGAVLAGKKAWPWAVLLQYMQSISDVSMEPWQQIKPAIPQPKPCRMAAAGILPHPQRCFVLLTAPPCAKWGKISPRS